MIRRQFPRVHSKNYILTTVSLSVIVLATLARAGNLVDFQCPQSDGDYADTTDNTCRNYIYCSNGRALRVKCGHGYKFHPHPNMRRCMLPDSVDCNERNPFACPVANAAVPDPKDCSRYYICTDWVPLHRTCEQGKTFAKALDICAYGYQSYCDSDENPSGTDFQCPVKDGQFPDEKDTTCGSFYKCIDWVAKRYDCSSLSRNLRFHPHPNMSRCVYHDEVDCSFPNPFVCPLAHIMLPDPRDCTRYYHCQDWAPVHKTCLEGQIFDPDWNKCVDGDEVNCLRRNSSGNQGGTQFQCPMRVGRFPDDQDPTCRNYYECNNWVARRVVCKNDFKFHSHPNMRRCLPPKEVDCNDPNPFVCPKANVGVPDPKDCSRYYHCQDWAPVHRMCLRGKTFIEAVRRCEYGDQSRCVADDSSGTQFQCPTTHGRFPVDQDSTCRNYYECNNGAARRLACERDYRFHPHPNMRRCLPPEQVDCNDPNPFVCPSANVDVPDPKDCSRFYSCQNWVPLHQTCQQGQTFFEAVRRCDYGFQSRCEEPNAFVCPSANVVVPDPKNCLRYYYCYNWVLSHSTCGEGQVFDVTWSQCLYGDQRTCDARNTSICPYPSVDVADPRNCAHYYRCVNYVPLVHACPQGQIFKWNRCQYGNAASC